jgi:hypothetical protein
LDKEVFKNIQIKNWRDAKKIKKIVDTGKKGSASGIVKHPRLLMFFYRKKKCFFKIRIELVNIEMGHDSYCTRYSTIRGVSGYILSG